MTSVTAVPLRPIAKGSVTSVWLGIALVVVVALGLAWAGTRSFKPLEFRVISEGTGPSPTLSDVALVSYVGKLDDGTVFDQNPQAPLEVSRVVKGFSEGLQRMKRGGHYELTIPARLGYGDQTAGPIPGGSTLHFDVKLIDFKSRAELEQAMRIQQQMQQMQGGAGMSPGGGNIPGPAPQGPPPVAVP